MNVENLIASLEAEAEKARAQARIDAAVAKRQRKASRRIAQDRARLRRTLERRSMQTMAKALADMRALRNRFAEPAVAAVVMHPTTYAKLLEQVERTDKPTPNSIEIRVNSVVPPGHVIPLDREGKPIMKPRAMPETPR